MSIFQRVASVIAATLLAVVLLVVAAWAAFGRPAAGVVVDNTTLAGQNVSGFTADQLAPVLATLETAYSSAPVTVGSADQHFTVAADTIGLQLDVDKTSANALAEGHSGSVANRIQQWLRSFTTKRKVDVAVAYDGPAIEQAVAVLDPGPRTPATEPSLSYADDKVSAVEGKDGRGLGTNGMEDAFGDAATKGLPLNVVTAPEDLSPRFPNGVAEALAEKANTALVPLPVKVGDNAATIEPNVQRSWARADTSGNTMSLAFDLDAIRATLGDVVTVGDVGPVEASYTIVNNGPVFVSGKPGGECCDDAASVSVRNALLESAETGTAPGEAVVLSRKPVYPKKNEETIKTLGIKEQISTFTTNYPAGQPRVTNIHKISDTVRGAIIEPGQIFSLNDYVGPRTAAKGYVSAGVISDAKFAESIGGGISQFSTTLFNAAFFGGLDWTEYQAHTIYISRYPYGREATISYPAPDQKIKNNTPYGILIWTTYNATSVTVTMYSTHYVDAEQTGQSERPVGACKRVSTERTRHYVDGRNAVDEVHAVYQPAEGVQC